MPLAHQYLPDFIRTIFIKAAAAPDDALTSHSFKETNHQGVWHITASAANCLFARFCRVRKGFFLLVLSCSCRAPAFPQAACHGSSQPGLGKYSNSSATQFFSALPDLFILGAFPRNLSWTDVVHFQIQVSYFFSWDYCPFSAHISSLGRISATMILPAHNTTS